ncbi:MAG: hypothetical protein O9327_05130 [Polaromonas sp.]|nr:hypothetical protein [Polaromonas sp.]
MKHLNQGRLALVLSLGLALCGLQGQVSAQSPARSDRGVAPVVVPPLPIDAVSREELKRTLGSKLPLTPEQTRQVRSTATEVHKARDSRLGAMPLPTVSQLKMGLGADAKPQVVRIAFGAATSIVFIDATGAQWPIDRVVFGAEGVISHDVPADAEGLSRNMLALTPITEGSVTNMVVFLRGAPAPLLFILADGQREVDFRLDVTVQARGPNAAAPVIARGLVESASAEMASMAAGIAPTGATELKVVGSVPSGARAWVQGGRMYVKTKATVLSPPVPRNGRVATSADGTKVYELPHAPQVLLMDDGSVATLRLEGFPPPTLDQLARTAGR